MKILLCTGIFKQTHNGAGVFARSLLAINSGIGGHELRVLTEDPEDDNEFVYPLAINIPAWLAPLGMFLRTFYYHREALRIRSVYPFDVIFYNNAFTGLWSAFTLGNRVKVFGFLHDDHFILPNEKNRKWTRKWLGWQFYHQIERLAARHFDKVFVNSTYLARLVQQIYLVPFDRIQPLYVTVDVDVIPFKLDRKIDSSQPVKILFVKNDFIRGGLEDLVSALALCKEFRFSVMIIGPFKEWKDQIERIVSGKGPNTEVQFLGVMPHSRIIQEMGKRNILCIPSRREAMGLANLEGLATGIPVITTIVGGIPEIMDDGNNGWLCNSGDPKDLARAIKECLNSPKERRLKSQKGRDFVEKNFRLEVMIRKLLRILESA